MWPFPKKSGKPTIDPELEQRREVSSVSLDAERSRLHLVLDVILKGDRRGDFAVIEAEFGKSKKKVLTIREGENQDD